MDGAAYPPQQEYPPQGYPQQEYPPQGYPQQPYPQQDYPPQQPPPQQPPPQQPPLQQPPPQQPPLQQPPAQPYPTQPQAYPQPYPVDYKSPAEAPPPYYGQQQQPYPQPVPAVQQQSSTNVVVVSQPAVASPVLVTTASTRDYYMTLSIVMTIICAFTFWVALVCTIPAIIIASNAREAASHGDEVEARQKGNIALGLNIGAISSFILFWVILSISLSIA